MNGNVLNHHILLNVRLRPPLHPDLFIEFVIDTGFVGYLTLPQAAIDALGLPFVRRLPANLADDTTINVRVYAATIVWHDEERDVEVLATGRRPLLGMLLLNGSLMDAAIYDGGQLSLRKP